MTVRLDRSTPRVKRRREKTSSPVRPVLRPLTLADRAPIEKIFSRIKLFSAAEVAVALEVLDASFVPGQKDYLTLGAELDGKVVGWVCWGATLCTVGT